jgi:hypothetical protein
MKSNYVHTGNRTKKSSARARPVFRAFGVVAAVTLAGLALAAGPEHLSVRSSKSQIVAENPISWGPNTIYFHGGEMPGFNSKISYDPTNQLTLIIWTNLTVSLDGQQTANTLFVKMLDHVYVVSPLR